MVREIQVNILQFITCQIVTATKSNTSVITSLCDPFEDGLVLSPSLSHVEEEEGNSELVFFILFFS